MKISINSKIIIISNESEHYNYENNNIDKKKFMIRFNYTRNNNVKTYIFAYIYTNNNIRKRRRNVQMTRKRKLDDRKRKEKNKIIGICWVALISFLFESFIPPPLMIPSTILQCGKPKPYFGILVVSPEIETNSLNSHCNLQGNS